MPDFIWEQTDRVVDWGSGFFVAYWTLLGIGQNFELLHFLNLFMLGITFALLFLGTRSLMPCVGLHGGLVTAMLVYKKLFTVKEVTLTWLWGSAAITDGVLTLALLIVLEEIFHRPPTPCIGRASVTERLVRALIAAPLPFGSCRVRIAVFESPSA